MARPRKYTDKQVRKLREMATTHCSVEIAEALGLELATVNYLCRKYKIPFGKTNLNQDRLTVSLGESTLSIYAQEADARKTTIRLLACQLLATIAKDNLFNAVLEDKRLTPPCKPIKKPAKEPSENS